MLVNDGSGPSGPLGDPLAGLTMPPGSPGALAPIAAQVSGWAGHLGTGAAGHRAAAADVVGSAWIGPDAARAGSSVATIASGAATVGNACDHAAQLLRTCEQQWAKAVADWHRAQRLASEAMADEAAHRKAGQTEVERLQTSASPDPTALSAAQAQADGSDGYESPERTQASTLGLSAVEAATKAIATAGTGVSEITAVVNVVGAHPDASKDGFWDKFMDMDIGGPATALVVPGTAGQVASWLRFRSFYQAFDDGDIDALSKLDPQGWSAVTKAADEYGPDSMEALKAQFKYMSELSGDVNTEAAASAVPIDGLPGGALGDTLDLVGKVALPLAVVGDVYTIADSKASGIDRVMSGANLAGIGMAATGTETGGAVVGYAAGLIGVNASLDWVPVAGEVVIVGTAVFLAADWAAHHWSDICHWTDDAGHAIETGYNDVNNAINDGTAAAGHVISQGIDDLGHAASSTVHAVSHTISSGLHDLGSVASDLDPF